MREKIKKKLQRNSGKDLDDDEDVSHKKSINLMIMTVMIMMRLMYHGRKIQGVEEPHHHHEG